MQIKAGSPPQSNQDTEGLGGINSTWILENIPAHVWVQGEDNNILFSNRLKNSNSCTLYVIFSSQSLCFFSIFYQISHFGAVVRYRLSSDLILNFNFNFSHEEFKN